MTSRANTQAIVSQLKESGQDNEWYPTTDEMLNTIRQHIAINYSRPSCNESTQPSVSVLDCGAGDGRALGALAGQHGDKYSIEISPILSARQPHDVIPVGTDFRLSTLIDKQVEIIFSNPPYSEYEEWAIKIIREANAKDAYLIIPERWQNSIAIANAIESRKAEAEVIFSGSFLDADRQARAKVDIVWVCFTFKAGSGEYEDRHGRTHQHSWSRGDLPKVDPFDTWFDETFPKQADENEPSEEGKKAKLDHECEKEMLAGKNLIESLVNLYMRDMAKLQQNYSAAASLDPELMRELQINHKGLKAALKERIKGLKNLYWHELFSNYESITRNLTTDSRKNILKKLHGNTSVDFTEDNAYVITMWVIRNSNKYFDEQLIELVERMSQRANVLLYKSNQRTFRDEDWRHNYRGDKPKNLALYALDYRIVLEHMGGVYSGRWNFERDTFNGLSEYAHSFISDILSVARTLGWNTRDTTTARGHFPRQWESNKKQEFVCENGEKLMEVRAFKNGNLHVKFNQKFIKKLNVEFGRLKGWLKDKQQVVDEMPAFKDAKEPEKPAITLEEAGEFFGSNLQLGHGASVLLLTDKSPNI